MNDKRCSTMKLIACTNVTLLASCVPEFEHPLPEPEELKADTRILGSGKMKAENDEVYAHVYPRKTGWLDIIYVSRDKGNEKDEESDMVFEKTGKHEADN